MTPEAIAAKFLNIDVGSLQAARIKNGLTNESYRVVGGNVPVVVRISNADEQALLIDRHSESLVLKLVEQAGIGAPVLCNLPQQHILITREIPGRNLTIEETGTEANIRRIAAMLSRLHSLAIHPEVQSMRLVDLLNHYWQLLGSWRDREQALEIAEESDAMTGRCLCHRDVHHLNLIDDGQRLWLLDWEYAVIGDSYFDLASVCCYHGFNPQQRLMLLESYTSLCAQPAKYRSLPPGGGETERGGSDSKRDAVADMSRLNRMCWLFDYIKELWFAARALKSAG